jgi:hypothetical protein
MNELTMDDLLLLLGHKEATLAVVSRQARMVIAENEALKAEIVVLKASLVVVE